MSHYNEKARWALDYFGVPYEESGYMPVLHLPAVAAATWRGSDARGDKISTRFSTPVLITDDGQRICNSSGIVRYLSDRFAADGQGLYPDPEVGELEQRYHDVLGAHTRRVAYYYALPDYRLARKIAANNVGLFQRAVFAALYPIGRRYLAKALNIHDRSAGRSRDVVRKEFAEASQRLEASEFLVGDRFTAADLSFAALAAPALLISTDEGAGAYLPTLDEAHDGAVEFAHELRATAAGRHALGMFRDHRHRPPS